MSFSESYLLESYEKSLDIAVKAKNAGNSRLAKEKFLESAKFLSSLAAIGDADKREERKQRAERLKAIGESINAGNTKQVSPGSNSFSGYNLGGISDIDVQIDDDEFKGIDEYITIFSPNDLEFGFDGVIGLDEAKDAIKDYVINPIKYKESYTYNYMDNTAILLYGPPGTGKTTFAKAVAKEVNEVFFLVNMAGLVNCYVGETAKNIDKIFNYIRYYVSKNKQDIIVFFDEMDEIAKKRGGDDKASEASVPALLRNLDGIKKNTGFIILANTNYKDMLDDAILSRFRRQVLIPLPDKDSRIKLLKLQINELEQDKIDSIDYEKFGEMSDGLSGRDIAYLADDFKRSISKHKAGLIKDLNLDDELIRLINTKKKG